MDYKNPDIINNSAKIIKINGYELEIILLDGTLYRGDVDTKPMLRSFPTWFGDYNSSFEYVSENEYLKQYKTKRPLKLLSVSNTKENIERIKNFFTNIKYPKFKKLPEIIYLLLQFSYGLIEGKFRNIDKGNLTIKDIKYFMRTNPIGSKMIIVNQNTIDIFIHIITNKYYKNAIPSRCSIKEIDKLLTSSLEQLLKSFEFDGIWFDNSVKIQDNSLCIKVNKDIFDSKSKELTCVPSEMTIFNPSRTLDIVKIEKYKDNTFTDIFVKKGGNYKNKYLDYKTKYLLLKTKLLFG